MNLQGGLQQLPSVSVSVSLMEEEAKKPLATAKVTRSSSTGSSGSKGMMLKGTVDDPSTPGRPNCPFSIRRQQQSATKKGGVSSKWEDAEKWLMMTSGHGGGGKDANVQAKNSRKGGAFARKGGILEGKDGVGLGCSGALLLQPCEPIPSSDAMRRDKFHDNKEVPISPKLGLPDAAVKHKCLVQLTSACHAPARSSLSESTARRDIGTETTPIGSSTTSRCHTPFKSLSPARHNTPLNWSGTLVPYKANNVDVSEIKDFHFSKVKLTAQFDSMVIANWSSKEEEEEVAAKSLRQFDANLFEKKNIDDQRAYAWEEEERTKSCIRYQREEAKIQAWVNLENAKAEAQSRKLEVKIQKMRSKLEEKLLKRMDYVQKHVGEWRAAAQEQHLQQLKRSSEHLVFKPKKISSVFSTSIEADCRCFPCSNNNGNLLT